nr:MAG TPA: hypothetical protein [Caudoviricetes sp.]
MIWVYVCLEEKIKKKRSGARLIALLMISRY